MQKTQKTRIVTYKRLKAALEIPYEDVEFYGEDAEKRVYLVKGNGAVYKVEVPKETTELIKCSCPDYRFRPVYCKHVLKVMVVDELNLPPKEAPYVMRERMSIVDMKVKV